MLTVSDESDCVVCRDPKHGSPCGAPALRVYDEYVSVIACPCENYVFLASETGFNLFSTEVIYG